MKTLEIELTIEQIEQAIEHELGFIAVLGEEITVEPVDTDYGKFDVLTLNGDCLCAVAFDKEAYIKQRYYTLKSLDKLRRGRARAIQKKTKVTESFLVSVLPLLHSREHRNAAVIGDFEGWRYFAIGRQRKDVYIISAEPIVTKRSKNTASSLTYSLADKLSAALSR